jgi:hypothetical protein
MRLLSQTTAVFFFNIQKKNSKNSILKIIRHANFHFQVLLKVTNAYKFYLYYVLSAFREKEKMRSPFKKNSYFFFCTYFSFLEKCTRFRSSKKKLEEKMSRTTTSGCSSGICCSLTTRCSVKYTVHT